MTAHTDEVRFTVWEKIQATTCILVVLTPPTVLVLLVDWTAPKGRNWLEIAPFLSGYSLAFVVGLALLYRIHIDPTAFDGPAEERKTPSGIKHRPERRTPSS